MTQSWTAPGAGVADQWDLAPPVMIEPTPEPQRRAGRITGALGASIALSLVVAVVGLIVVRPAPGGQTITAAALRGSSSALARANSSTLKIHVGGAADLTVTIVLRSDPTTQSVSLTETIPHPGGGSPATVEARGIGPDLWMKLPPGINQPGLTTSPTRPWLHLVLPVEQRKAFASQSQQAGAYLAAIVAEPTSTGTERVDGVTLHTFKVALDLSKLSIAPAGSPAATALAGIAPTTATVGVDDAGRLRLFRYRVDVAGASVDSELRVTSFDIGDPITAPSADQVTEAPATAFALLQQMSGTKAP